MTALSNKLRVMRGTEDLDKVIRELMTLKGLTKSQASNLVAFEIRKMMKSKQRSKKIDLQLKFF